jgi:hypothetical protein
MNLDVTDTVDAKHDQGKVLTICYVCVFGVESFIVMGWKQ